MADNVWFMLLPAPSEPPDTPSWLAVHVKVVPGKLLVNAIEVVIPEQIV